MASRSKNEFIELFYDKRKNGTDFSELRTELEAEGVEPQLVNEIIAAINERELDNLEVPNNYLNPNIFLYLGIATLFSGIGLGYFLQSISVDSNYQLLNAIPVAGSLVLFYNYYTHKNRSKHHRR